ncbi:glutathione S-transferase family protein [Veronia pacifica]|uniref:GST N-terminal domain-containing protein n=1 Tax=Veronia pacifica TaxID=1080227 RepID=A0A1C3EPC5_9GAMM|nr:glutathione S-transferase family protein [Veronia pacifica]ODA35095.1 hypothetical protein A8L45_05305 [Veronia pacifica]
MHQAPSTPWTLYRSSISYFSGKVEAYLRYKQIPFTYKDIDYCTLNKIYMNTGFKKMPALEAEDGRWLFDSTPMIHWLEQCYGGSPIYPSDPALRFLAILIEDYGDEWLWRPAMWWRWVPETSRRALGWTIATEIIHPWLGRPAGWWFAKRQQNEWLWKDGVNKHNSNDVKEMLFREFEFLEPLLEEQPFILGSHPSIADYGYFASMFRHFGNDPVSAETMRIHAPNTYEWLSRMWNAKPEKLPKSQSWIKPEQPYWKPLLDRIGNDYLPYLKQNADAFAAGKRRFDFVGRNLRFPSTKTTRYRVWCYSQLQKAFNQLTEQEKATVIEMFSGIEGFTSFIREARIETNMDDDFALPRYPKNKKRARFSLFVWLFGQPRN